MGSSSHAVLSILTFCFLIASGFSIEFKVYKAEIDDETFSAQSSVSVTFSGNSSVSGQKLFMKSSLSHMFHANSTLLPKDCDELCVGRIRSKSIGKYLRARLDKRRNLAVLNRVSVLWMDSQKVSEWYVKLAITDTLDDPNPQLVRVVPDTGSFFTWVQCRPCDQCYPQRWKLFNPRISQRYNALGQNHPYCQRVLSTGIRWTEPQDPNDFCRYKVIYQDGTISFGVVSTDHFRFSNLAQNGYVLLQNVGFGCGYRNKQGTNTGMSGLLGLSRAGGVSIPEQFGTHFGSSYGFCFPIPGTQEDAGFFVLGDNGMPVPGEEGFQSIDFPTGGRPQYFYLDAVDMMLDGRGVGVPADTFTFNADGTGGLMMDTGTMISDFKPAAYTVFRDAYRNFMTPLLGDIRFGGKHGFDTCWDVSGIDLGTLGLPSMGFMLRNGLQFEFGRIASYFTYITTSRRPILCLPMIPYDDNLHKWNIFGAYQMMEIDMNFDVGNNRLVWKGDSC